MYRSLLLLVTVAVVTAAPAVAEEPVTKEEVVRLLQEGFSEALIVEKIETSGADIDLSVEAMVELKSAGATDDVLRAILENQTAASAETPSEIAPPADMVLIPAGEFIMGSDDGEEDYAPAHRVYVNAFYIDKYEVTNADYEEFDPAHIRGSASECDECPVTNVSKRNAAAYARWAERRLPTEAEWEKAARGPEGYLYGHGDKYDKRLVNAQASAAVRVGSYPWNGYGVYDMLGNVWEWCADYYSKAYYSQSPDRNPSGPSQGLGSIVRGGSFRNGKEVHVAVRTWRNSSYRFRSIGFRCARDVVPQQQPPRSE